VVFWIGSSLSPSPLQIAYYVLLVLNALLIATAFHIAVLSLGIITLEVDHMIMVYRDLASMGRFPVDIYREPIKSILTFVVPVGIMVTVPAKAMAGLIGPLGVALAVAFGLFVFFLSLKLWDHALKKYTSASS
jgi:ABC-2 type transport system permease protein